MSVRDESPQHRSRAMLQALAGVALALSLGVPSSWALPPTEGAADGEALYQAHCARCHEGQVKRAPHRSVMQRLPAVMVLHSLEIGKMQFQGMTRTNQERRALAEWITDKQLPPPTDKDETVAGFCADAPGEFVVEDGAAQWKRLGGGCL